MLHYSLLYCSRIRGRVELQRGRVELVELQSVANRKKLTYWYFLILILVRNFSYSYLYEYGRYCSIYNPFKYTTSSIEIQYSYGKELQIALVIIILVMNGTGAYAARARCGFKTSSKPARAHCFTRTPLVPQ